MTVASSCTKAETRLPPLSGRWVAAYQLLWAALAVLAISLLAASAYRGDSAAAVLVLRVMKAGVLISVCAVLLRRRRDDPVAAFLSLAFLTWTITSSFDFASAAIIPMLGDRLRFLLFALALLLFPDGHWRPAWTRRVAATSAAVCVLGIVEAIGWISTRLFLPCAILCVIAAVGALIVRFRTAETEAVRQQLKWVALGLVSGIPMILAARAGAALAPLAPRLGALPILWEGLFQLGIIVLALGFLISLLRYRLFDAEAAISRSAALAVLTLALVATFAGTEASIEWVGQQYFGMGIGNVSAAMAAAVAAVLLNPLHGRISGWAEHHFQRDLVALRRDLPELLEDLAGVASAKELATAALARICEAVHATRAEIVSDTEVLGAHGVDRGALTHSSTSPSRSQKLFPLRFAMHRAGRPIAACLLLGPRPDGSLYGKDDLDAVNEILPALRRALTAALRNEAVHEEYRRNGIALNEQLDDLRSRLNVLEAARREFG